MLILPAQQEFRALVTATAESEQVKVLVPNPEVHQYAQASLPAGVELLVCPYGDIWMRDIAPIFVHDRTKGTVVAQTFAWNGWGQM